MQDRESLSINSADTSISRSKQLEAAIPPSKISALSSGEFVGMVADDPGNKIELKTFHCQIENDHEALKLEQEKYKEIPIIRKLDNGIIQRNYLQIKEDIQNIIQSEMKRVMDDPALSLLVISK
jgi:TusA-related sulfurtransferase